MRVLVDKNTVCPYNYGLTTAVCTIVVWLLLFIAVTWAWKTKQKSVS